MATSSNFRCALLALIAAAGLHSSAQAQLIPGYSDDVRAYDPREVAPLPDYCKYTQEFRERVPGGGDPRLIEYWYKTLGPTYNALHHYCWGLMKARRGMLLARTELARTHFLSDAVREYDYVIEHSGQDFVLLPEVLAKKGEALLRLGKSPAAMVAFERAIAIKPDYWPPYAHASDYYKEIGEIEQARELLTRGLASAPNTSALQRRLTELDSARTIRRSSKP
jgi:tetratricopeptide (TPR) repeat protein